MTPNFNSIEEETTRRIYSTFSIFSRQCREVPPLSCRSTSQTPRSATDDSHRLIVDQTHEEFDSHQHSHPQGLIGRSSFEVQNVLKTSGLSVLLKKLMPQTNGYEFLQCLCSIGGRARQRVGRVPDASFSSIIRLYESLCSNAL